MRTDNFRSDGLIWLLAMLCVWPGLGAYGVLNNNEGLYAMIPFEMLKSGDIRDWIIPHLNSLPYLEKPPLLYWLTAISFSIFGYAEWVVRLVPTLSGLACVGLLLNFGRRTGYLAVGRFGALMFISGLGVTLVSRTLVFDVLLTAFVTATLLHSYYYLMDEKKRDLRIAAVCLALGVLTKGLVAIIIVGLVVLAWMILLYRSAFFMQLKKWFDPSAIGLFFLVAAPWFIAASVIEPIFPWFFFINEHVLRFLGLRVPHDYYSGPWWYYLPRMIIYLFPWSLLAPIALMSKTINQDALLKKMLMLGWLMPLAFFSLSSAKANYYLVVAIPFVALHLALVLKQSDFLQGRRSMLLGIVLALLVGGAVITLQFLMPDVLPKVVASKFDLMNLDFWGMPVSTSVLVLLWTVVGLSLVCALIAWRIPRIGLMAYVMLPLFSVAVGLVVMSVTESTLSDRAMANYIRQNFPERAVYLYHDFEENSALPFYLKKSVKVIDRYSSDLYWGDKLRPGNTVSVTWKQFESEGTPKVVVVNNRHLAEFVYKKMHSKFTHSKQFGYATLMY